MRIEGRQNFIASPEIVWSLVQDPLTLQNVLPGCEKFEPISPDEYRLTLNVPIGPVPWSMSGTLRFMEIDPPRGFQFAVQLDGPEGSLASSGRATLVMETSGNTLFSYEADIEAGGALAGASSRMLLTSARAFARRTLEGLDRHVAMRTRIYTTFTTPLATPASTPSLATVERITRVRGLLTVGLILLGILLFGRMRERRRVRQIARQVVDTLKQNDARVDPATSPEIALSRS